MPVTINGTNGITFNNSSTQAQSAGLGSSATAQTWQFPSRAINTTYTNSTGYPIMVYSTWASSGGAWDPTPVVAGVSLGRGGAVSNNGAYATISFIVPNGATYSVNGTAAFNSWAELR
jgi:hypothetical protein